jgi:thymidine kinase
MSVLISSNQMFHAVSYLKIIIGPMWSGKTSEVINIYKHNCIAQIPTVIINFEEDTRYHDEKLSSHDKIMLPCSKYKTLAPLLHKISNYKCFIIDEAQFFPDLYLVVEKLLDAGKIVYVCGLDSDFQMKKFGHILDIIPLADEIIKKQALCAICRNGKKASFSKRLTKDTVQKLIGAVNYIPVCRECHKK